MRGRFALFVPVAMTLWACSDSPTAPASAPASAPALLAPVAEATLDNGCTTGTDRIRWDFDWSDVPGATSYHLYAVGPGAESALINEQPSASSYAFSGRGYIVDRNRLGWRWRVRALVKGTWTPWTAERTFDVEPLNTDCP